MHASAYQFAKSVLEGHTFKGVVEFGARNVNGTVRGLVKHNFAYIGVDIKPGPDVDVVMDAAEYRGDPVELVVCMETLEHAPNWAGIVASAAKNLLSGGTFLMTCAGIGRAPHSAIDGGQLRRGEYYQNIDLNEFHKVAEASGLIVERLEHHVSIGDLYAACTAK